MIEKNEITIMMRSVASAVKIYFAESVAPLIERIDGLAAFVQSTPAGPKGDKGDQGDKGERGEQGKAGESVKGDPGKDADPELIRAEVEKAVKAAVDALPRPKDGQRGENGRDGKDGESVHHDTVFRMIAEQVSAAMAKIQNGKDGAPGRDAAEIVPITAIDESRSYAAGTWARYNGGLIRAARQTDPAKDGSIVDAGWLVMVEGIAGIAVSQDTDPRSLTVAASLTSGAKTIKNFRVPMVIDCGVWRDGKYQHGDSVSWDGSLWIAQRETFDKPGTSDHWRLSTKRGRDGKDAKIIQEPRRDTVARIK